jgi:hypothetical protein
VNREKPFNDALRIALKRDPLRLHRIAERLADKAEEGGLAAIREIADRLDGKPAQIVDRHDVRTADELTDAELHFLIRQHMRSEALLIPPVSKSEK